MKRKLSHYAVALTLTGMAVFSVPQVSQADTSWSLSVGSWPVVEDIHYYGMPVYQLSIGHYDQHAGSYYRPHRQFKKHYREHNRHGRPYYREYRHSRHRGHNCR